MPKYRQLHTKIIDSFDFSEMPNDFTRVVWLLMIVVVDSAGRGIYNMAWLRSRMFPLRSDVTLEQLSEAMEWLANRGMIIRYSFDGKSYFYIAKFNNYQTGTDKEAPSVLPSPPEELQSNSGVTPELVSVNTISIQYKDNINTMPCGDDHRPNIFKCYERSIGMITPTMSEILQQAEKDYSSEWIEEAFELAVKANVRKWSYVDRILRNWATDGKKGNGTNYKKTETIDMHGYTEAK